MAGGPKLRSKLAKSQVSSSAIKCVIFVVATLASAPVAEIDFGAQLQVSPNYFNQN